MQPQQALYHLFIPPVNNIPDIPLGEDCRQANFTLLKRRSLRDSLSRIMPDNAEDKKVPDYMAPCKEDVDRQFNRMKQALYTMVEQNIDEPKSQRLAKQLTKQVCNECWHTMLRLMNLEEESNATRDSNPRS